MVGRFTILGAFAPHSIVVFDKGEGEEKKEGGEMQLGFLVQRFCM